MFTQSDGGREKAGIIERLDCTVRAYAIAFDIPYHVAHEEIKRAGRRDGHKWRDFAPFMAARGLLKVSPLIRPTVGAFIAEHKSGVYIVRVRGHVLTVKNGTVYDIADNARRCQVKAFWAVPQ